MKIARKFLPAGVTEGTYTLTNDATGTREYRVEAAAPVGTIFAGADWNDYVVVMVWTSIGWSPIKTAARADDILAQIAATL